MYISSSQTDEDVKPRKYEIVWRNVAVLLYLHLAAVYGFALILLGYCQFKTIVFIFALAYISSIGITGGVHRLWAHRSYKANLPLRILLATMSTMTFQNHIYEWVRDHRVHHKFSETDVDPHNAKRGFFFAHVGWLMVKKHPDVITKGKTIDLSDLEQDAVVMFQKRFYIPLVILLTFALPALVPYYFWNESLWVSYHCASMFRYVFAVNLTWCINSAAHLYGMKPYDKNIGPTENPTMRILGLGEGFHNYHHTFPWDYKAAEFGNDSRNSTTYMIDFFAKLKWATELKTAPREMIKRRAERTGDGTWVDTDDVEIRKNFVEKDDGKKVNVWGWGDFEMNEKDKKEIDCYNFNFVGMY